VKYLVTIYAVNYIYKYTIQFTLFTNRSVYLIFCFIPIIPFTFGKTIPVTIMYTNLVKPLSQILSHMPQMWVTYQKQSTEGVSLATQHFNLLGGFAGMYMYSIIPPKSMWTYVVYVNSLFQAVSLYWMAVHYDGWDRLIKSMDMISWIRTWNSKSILSINSNDDASTPSPTKEDDKLSKSGNDDLKANV